jgi:hypothetical protein
MNDRVQKIKEQYEHEAFLYLLQEDVYVETEDVASDGEIGRDDDVDDAPKLYEFRDEEADAYIYIKYALDNKTKEVRRKIQVKLGRARMVDRPLSERDKEAREWRAVRVIGGGAWFELLASLVFFQTNSIISD